MSESESSSYSSLLDLVDTHLSRVNVQRDADTTENEPSTIQSNSKFGIGTGKRLAIPSLNLSGNLVSNVLAEQVSNMLKAKQSKEIQQQKLIEDMKVIHLNDDHETETDVIDLMEVVRIPFKSAVKCNSAYSLMESLFEPEFIEFDEESSSKNHQLTPTLLMCQTDLSYILDIKVLQAKCSNFGKILVSRLRTFSSPYKKNISYSSVQKFDFKSKSPCDILKERTMHKVL